MYELPSSDKPDDDVFEDDAALDRWYDQYLRDIARKASRSNRHQTYQGPHIEYAGGAPG